METLALKNINILLVEDDINIRKNAIEFLSYYCDNVFEAVDGVDGYNKYLTIHPHIIITDIQMPKLNGLKMIEKIRQDDKITQIIITTAYIDTKYLLQAVELQLVRYLTKPIYESQLIPALKDALTFINIETSSNILYFNDGYRYDLLNKVMFHNDNCVKLNKKETLLLNFCCQNNTRIVKYIELNNYIWDGQMSQYALSSLVKDLRKKIPEVTLENISGCGYKINPRSIPK